MREVEVPLNCFGPRRLSEWLYQHWEESDETTRIALRELIPDPVFESDTAPDLRELIARLEYEHVLAALSEGDFERFVEEVLANPDNAEVQRSYPYTPGWDEMQEHPAALRQRLRTYFRSTALHPHEDFLQLVEHASVELAEASQRLGETVPTMSRVHHAAAVRIIYGTVDRVLQVAERFVQLAVEFLASVADTLPDRDTQAVTEWLSPYKKGSKGWLKSWENRLSDASEAASAILDAMQRTDGQRLGYARWPLLSFCREWTRNKETVTNGFTYQRSEGLGNVFYRMKEIRNMARHSAGGLRTEGGLPVAYAEVIREGYRLITQAHQRMSEVNTPALVRLVGYSRDCLGGLELHFAWTGGFWYANYPVEAVAQSLGLAPNDIEALLAFEKEEPECFLFPAPAAGKRRIWNPLVVRRLRMEKMRPVVRLHFEEIEPGPPGEDEGWAIGA